MTIDDGGSVMAWEGHGGLSKRDWFAGMALSGSIELGSVMYSKGPMGDNDSIKADIATTAYEIADAMLEERARNEKAS